MKIEIREDPGNDQFIFKAAVPRSYLIEKCQRHPAADLITPDQAMGIIEDAVLMALGMELTPKEKQDV